jgi:phosphatidylserine decarboxylase
MEFDTHRAVDQAQRPVTEPEPMPANIRSIQPGGGFAASMELLWGRLRRRWLKTVRPGYVRRMRDKLRGDPKACPVEVIDSRDLKYFRNVADCWFDPADDRFRRRDKWPFARDGFAELIVFGGGAAVLAMVLATGWIVAPYWAGIPALAATFVFWFFRDPERTIPNTTSVMVSPADGKIVEITRLDDHPFIGEPAIRIGIFLSVFDVHVNRSVMTGRVIRLRYQPGRFRNAMSPASAHENESMEISFVQTQYPFRRYVVRQIAGAIARRIVCWIRPGEIVETGQRFGMIKFGSRTELVIPSSGFEPAVALGDRVHGGASVLGHYRPEASKG